MRVDLHRSLAMCRSTEAVLRCPYVGRNFAMADSEEFLSCYLPSVFNVDSELVIDWTDYSSTWCVKIEDVGGWEMTIFSRFDVALRAVGYGYFY